MNTQENKKSLEKKLIEDLSSIDIKSISTKEINFFHNKAILITGASGIIGLNLLFFFYKISREKKIKITIDGTYNSYLFNFVKKYFNKNKKVNFIKIDLTEHKIKNNKKYDLIFHCAGYGQPSKFLRYKTSTYKLNSNVLMDLSNKLKMKGRFIYMSSTEIYSGNKNLCTEESNGFTNTNHPRSTYIESKKFGESFIINCIKNYVIFRVCLTYGVGAKLNDERVLNQVILKSLINKHIDVYGGLNQLRSNLYIDDAVIMMIKSIFKSSNQIYNINNHQMSTLGNIFSTISKLSKKKLINHGSKMKGSPSIIKISNKKILKYLNYKISTSLKGGLTKTINWYSNLIQYNKIS